MFPVYGSGVLVHLVELGLLCHPLSVGPYDAADVGSAEPVGRVGLAARLRDDIAEQTSPAFCSSGRPAMSVTILLFTAPGKCTELEFTLLIRSECRFP